MSEYKSKEFIDGWNARLDNESVGDGTEWEAGWDAADDEINFLRDRFTVCVAHELATSSPAEGNHKPRTEKKT